MSRAEIWAPVVGWEGLYEVSSHGRIRSHDRTVRCGYGRTRVVPGRVIAGWAHHGYPMVVLTLAGRPSRRVFVHRLVCEAFHGPAPSPTHEVAHADGNPANAHAGNLRWATHAENEADKIGHGTHVTGERHGCAKLTEADIIQIRKSSDRGCDLAERFGVTRSAITLIRKGRLWRQLDAA